VAGTRTQAQRSATTQQALLDATIECLVQEGYANTTTTRVAERAGMSRGAHLHHFQTRSALVAAAVEHLRVRRAEELMAAADALPSGPERVTRALDLLWRSYTSPLFQGALDLWAAGRTDPELREHLVKIEREFDRQTIELARRMFPEAAERPDFDKLIELAASTIRGLTLLDTLHPGRGRSRRQWPFCRARLAELFEPPLPS
jgi:AcrR family transcriptional regulator